MSDTQTYFDADLGKDSWGTGPWLNEPDKAVWVDPLTSLDCMVRRGGGGAWCGYVGVSKLHPFFGVDYNGCYERPRCNAPYCDHTPEAHMDVHGGLTFSGSCDEDGPVESAICHVPGPGRPAEVWWFGFDCGHSWDLKPGSRYPSDDQSVYRDINYVTGETLSLARQVAAAWS